MTKILIIMLTMLFIGCSDKPSISNEEVSNIDFAEQIILHLKKNENNEVIKKFHFAELNEKELEKEKANILLSLDVIMLNFGQIIAYTRKNENNMKYMVGTSSLDNHYWDNKHFERVNYIISSTKQKKAYLVIDIVNIKKKIELKAVSFGISMQEKNSKEKISNIFNEIIALRRSRAEI